MSEQFSCLHTPYTLTLEADGQLGLSAWLEPGRRPNSGGQKKRQWASVGPAVFVNQTGAADQRSSQELTWRLGAQGPQGHVKGTGNIFGCCFGFFLGHEAACHSVYVKIRSQLWSGKFLPPPLCKFQGLNSGSLARAPTICICQPSPIVG